VADELGKKVLLIVLDGWGISPLIEGNAPFLANTPILDYIYTHYPKTLLSASGLQVGLDRNEVGNSEVGHLNLGTGRIIWESLPRINNAIEEGKFFGNENFQAFLLKTRGKKLHLIGLVSDGGVHSHIDHLIKSLEYAKETGLENVYIHVITDGRDTSPKKAKEFIAKLNSEISRIGVGKIASVVGRFYAMDRDERWERVEKAYRLYTKGVGKQYDSADEAIDANYQNEKDDEEIEPSIIDKAGLVENGDSIFFYNFRADRMRELVKAFYAYELDGFQRVKIDPLNILTMTEYDVRMKIPEIFSPISLENTVADVLGQNNISQYHVAETEKYPHVTYFFNGGLEELHKFETQKVVLSPRVTSYDQKPEMSAPEVADKTLEAINFGERFILLNFANGDMVGHTGVIDAGIAACETVDRELEKVLVTAALNKYQTIITADHGNCEIMIDPATGGIHKEHTTSPVPFIYLDFLQNPFNISKGAKLSEDEYKSYASIDTSGVLSDISSTVLTLLNLEVPSEMTKIDLTKLI